MPVKKQYRVLEKFTFLPKKNVVMTFKPGQVVEGLTRACLEKAGDRVLEIRDESSDTPHPRLGQALDEAPDGV